MTAVAEVRPATASPHLSASQLRGYADCSLQWYLGRHFRPAFSSPGLVFGSAFHNGAQAYYQARIEGRAITLPDVMPAFTETIQKPRAPIRYTKGETKINLIALGERVLGAFLEQARPGEIPG